MYRNDLNQASASNSTSTEIVQLATNFLFKKDGNNTLLLIGWKDSQYNDIIQNAKSNCNRGKEVISYAFSAVKQYTAIEHYEYATKTYNTLYAVEKLNNTNLVPIVVKYDHESILNSSQKPLNDANLTIVCNDNSQSEQLNAFTDDNRIAYYEDNICVYTPDQFKDLIGNLNCTSE